MTELADRIDVWLGARPGEYLVNSIARGVTARTKTVRETLQQDSRFVGRPRGLWLSDKAQVWKLAPVAQDGPGRVKQPSQCDRILTLLQRNSHRWVTTGEILRHVPSIVHSRIAELNQRGGGVYRIDHQGSGGGAENHRYRYVSLLESASAYEGPDADSSGAVPSADPAAAAPIQLTLDAVAA